MRCCSRAGLLDNHKATHWAFVPCLQKFTAITVDTSHKRFLVSQTQNPPENRLTGGGISSGLDEALQLISILFGEGAAEEVQVTTEYFPEPPVMGVIPGTTECPIKWD